MESILFYLSIEGSATFFNFFQTAGRMHIIAFESPCKFKLDVVSSQEWNITVISTQSIIIHECLFSDYTFFLMVAYTKIIWRLISESCLYSNRVWCDLSLQKWLFIHIMIFLFRRCLVHFTNQNIWLLKNTFTNRSIFHDSSELNHTISCPLWADIHDLLVWLLELPRKLFFYHRAPIFQ